MQHVSHILQISLCAHSLQGRDALGLSWIIQLGVYYIIQVVHNGLHSICIYFSVPIPVKLMAFLALSRVVVDIAMVQS